MPKEMPYLSVIERKRGKKPYKALMAGPLRFVNHHCRPNAVVSPILPRESRRCRTNVNPRQMLKVLDHRGDKVLPAIMLQSIRSIKPGEAITVDYGELYWDAAWVCRCSDCDKEKPKATRKRETPPLDIQPGASNVRLGKKRRRIRKQKPPMDAGEALEAYRAQAGDVRGGCDKHGTANGSSC